MRVDVVGLGLRDLAGDGGLPFEDPHGVCRVGPRVLRAFRENPFRGDDEAACQLVGAVDGCAAGSLMLLPGRIVVEGGDFPIVWCSGLYVVPAYRKTLLGLSLIKKARASGVMVGGSRVAGGAFALFERLGWTGVALTRYILPCRSGPILERVLGAGGLASALAHGLDGMLSVHRGLLRAREKRGMDGVRCEPVGAMPETLDAELAGLSRPFGCHRSSRWLNWVLKNSFDPDPRNQKELFLVSDARDRVVAYFMTRVKHHERLAGYGLANVSVGSVLDWGLLERTIVTEERLWLMATNALIRAGVDVVEICDMRPDAALPLGFRGAGEHRMVLFSSAEGPTITGEALRRWRVRQADGDSGLA